MENLIKINENGVEAISARELQKALNLKKDFTSWCKTMFSYGFEEGVDYIVTKMGEPDNQAFVNPNPKVDYVLTLDTAKHIAMIQRTPEGMKIRQYFIDYEKSKSTQIDFSDPDTVVKIANKWKEEYHLRIAAEKQLKIQEPKVEYVDKLLKSETSFSTTELAADFGMSAIKFNKILMEKGIIRKMSTGYVLCSSYLNRGYEYMLPIEKEGQSKRQLRWTERGRAFIHYLLDKPMQTKLTLIS